VPGAGKGSLGLMQAPAVQRRPVNLSVSAEMLGAAREARVNLSALLERALTGELTRLRRRRWREENVGAVRAYNEHLASHGTCFEGRLDE
jgi:antitoxin CcdA